MAASRNSLFVSWHDINFLVPKNKQDKAWEDLSDIPSILITTQVATNLTTT